MINLEEDKNFVNNVLDKIKEEKISPKPKWQFLLKNSLIWTLGIVSLILGAIATSLVFYMVTGEDSGLGHQGTNVLEALMFVIPFFWLICLAIFAFSVFYYIKHTKKGYKYSAKTIILGIVVISLFLGGVLSALGVDRLIDDKLGEKAPLYDRFINPRLDYWSNPDKGRLTGMVISYKQPVTYYLIDRAGETWVTELKDKDDFNKIEVNRPVRFVGEKVGDHSFIVTDVLSVGPGRGFFQRPLPPMVPGMPLPPMCNHEKPCEDRIKKEHQKIIKEELKINFTKPTN